MVVDEVHINRLAIFEPKDDAQVAAHAHAPESGKHTTPEWVEPVPWDVEVPRPPCRIKVSQDASDAGHEVLRQSTGSVRLVQGSQRLVRESHGAIVTRNGTICT